MCSPAICRSCGKVTYSGCGRPCGKVTYSGCGRHVDQVMASVPEPRQCTCR